MNIQPKLDLLLDTLRSFGRIAIAFSGGVDSTFLLLAAREALGHAALAVTATGCHFAPDELMEAQSLCEQKEIPQLLINVDESMQRLFSQNPPDRCYHCKKTIFGLMRDALGDDFPIADGTNTDDADDYRPGRRALKELGILSPLEEAGFTKAEIREGLIAMNVPLWNKPAAACLASRIPYGEPITRKKLERIYRAEQEMHSLGFQTVRVRSHADTARIEVPPEERHRFFDERFMDRVNRRLQKAGFLYVSLDLGGYRRGSLNRSLHTNQKEKKE